MDFTIDELVDAHLIYENESLYSPVSSISDAPTTLANEFPKPSYANWNQGSCGNCWVWAGTGALAQSLFKHTNTATPLSIQFFNSNYMDGNRISVKPNDWACTGGSSSMFANIYEEGLNQSYPEGPFVVPWSNFNASYQDAAVPPQSQYSQTTHPKTFITNTPNIGFSQIKVERVLADPPTNQTAAVENITRALVDGKVVIYGMDLPNATAWNQFNNMWSNQPNAIWNMDVYNQSYYNESDDEGGGHALVLIGYNKTDADTAKHYWIIQNSWGNSTLRPKGQYNLKMWVDYNATFNNTGSSTQAFEVLNVTWKTDPTVSSITPAGGQNTGKVSITDLAGTNYADDADVMLRASGITPRHITSLVNGTDGALLANPYDITITNNYAYIASYNNSALEIVNLSDPLAPVHKGNIVTGSGGALLNGAMSVSVSGDYAYIASKLDNALEIVNISIPSAPVHKGKITDGTGGAALSGPSSVKVVGNYAYIASSGSNALEIVNVSNPAAPVHEGSIANGGAVMLNNPVSVDVAGNYAYIASYGSNALEIVNVSDPSTPIHTSKITDGTGGALLMAPECVTVVGYYAYIASSGSNALEIVDISNQSVPVHKGSLVKTAGVTYLNSPVYITISSDRMFAYVTSPGGNTLDIVNVTDPASPVYTAGLSTGTGGAHLDGASSVGIYRFLAYVTSRGSDALEVVALNTIPGTQISVVTAQKITGTFDLTGAPTGNWDVVVTNVNSRFATLSNGFAISAAPPQPHPDNGVGGSGAASGLVASTVSGVVAGQPVTFSFNQNPTVTSPVALNQAQIMFNQNLGTVEVIGGTVSSESSLQGQTVVGYFSIELVGVNPNVVGSTTISYSVNRQYLRDHHLEPSQVALMRNHEGVWSTLPTTLVSQNGDINNYASQSPGLSYFAVVVPKSGNVTNTDINTTLAPSVTPSAGKVSTPSVTGSPAQPAVQSARTILPLKTTTTPVPAVTFMDFGVSWMVVVGIVAAIAIVVIGAGLLVRRWWIRRQNPALFRRFN